MSHILPILLCFCLTSQPLLLKAHVFDTLKTVPAGMQWKTGAQIFNSRILNMDAENAFAEIKALSEYAEESNKRELEVLAIAFEAFYYINRIPEEKHLGIELLKNSIELAQKFNLPHYTANLTYHLGINLYMAHDYPAGFENMLRADKMMLGIGYENIESASRFLYRIGQAYYDFANYKRAVYYWQQALQYSSGAYEVEIESHNAIGMAYQELGISDSALAYFQKAFDMAVEQSDTPRIGLIGGNIGVIYFRKSQNNLAKPLLKKDYELAIHYKNLESAALASLILTDIYIHEDSLNESMKHIQKAGMIIREHFPNNLKLWSDYYKSMAMITKSAGDYYASVTYIDSFMVAKDSLTAQRDANMLMNLEAQVMTEKYLADLELLEKEKTIERIIRNQVILILVLGLIFISGIFYSLRMKQARERQRILSDKIYAEKMLASYIASVREKNKVIENFREEITRLQAEAGQEISPEREKILDKLYHSKILTEDDWNQFRHLFEKVHSNFFINLKTRYPNLTTAETRLLTLIRLNLSNQEIAAMLGISSESVRKTGQRLRRKLNIHGPTDLFQLLSGLK